MILIHYDLFPKFQIDGEIVKLLKARAILGAPIFNVGSQKAGGLALAKAGLGKYFTILAEFNENISAMKPRSHKVNRFLNYQKC